MDLYRYLGNVYRCPAVTIEPARLWRTGSLAELCDQSQGQYTILALGKG